jgi:hypothetical protein
MADHTHDGAAEAAREDPPNGGRPPLSPHTFETINGSTQTSPMRTIDTLGRSRRAATTDNTPHMTATDATATPDDGLRSTRGLVEITLPRHRNSQSGASLSRSWLNSVGSRRRSSGGGTANNSINLARNTSMHSTTTEPAARRTHTHTPTFLPPAAIQATMGANLQRRNEEQARRAAVADSELAQRATRQTAAVAATATRAADATATRNVYVSGLAPATSDDALRALFEPFGEVHSVRICRRAEGSRDATSYGFVLMGAQAGADHAIRTLHNQERSGLRLQVRLATRGPGNGGTSSGPVPADVPRHRSSSLRPATATTSRAVSPSTAHSYAAPASSYAYGSMPLAQPHAAHAHAAPHAAAPANHPYLFMPVNMAPTTATPPNAATSASGAVDLSTLFAHRAELWAQLQQVDANIQRIFAQQAARANAGTPPTMYFYQRPDTHRTHSPARMIDPRWAQHLAS